VTTETIEGVSADDVGARTISEAISATTYESECSRPCRSQAVAQLALDGEDVIQLRRVRGAHEDRSPSRLDDASVPHLLRVAHRRSGRWFVWDGGIQIGIGCHAGGCVTELVERIEVARTSAIAWFRIRILRERSFSSDLSSFAHRYDLVIGCKMSPSLSCAQARGEADKGSVSIIRGNQVVTRIDDDPLRYVITTFAL
jgi:hypothetical protein